MPTIERRQAASIGAVQLATVRPDRRALIVYNDSQAILTLRLGAPPDDDSLTTRIGGGGHWDYAGPDSVYGAWDSAQGAAYVTELL